MPAEFLLLVRPDPTDPRPHVELRVLAHAVGVPYVAAIVRGLLVFEALEYRPLFLHDARELFDALQKTEGGLAAGVGLLLGASE